MCFSESRTVAFANLTCIMYSRPRTFRIVCVQPLQNKGNCLGWACHDDKGHMVPYIFERRKLWPDDVLCQITYCGMCHTDLHHVKNEWGVSTFPLVPGHELIGVIVDAGKDVSKFKVGDLAGIGCMVDSCGACDYCKESEEQHCRKGVVATYNSMCAPSPVLDLVARGAKH
jgi:D-arabinose 1-dehydrogenase-like Zn-dependent alcohol dehydrogenase